MLHTKRVTKAGGVSVPVALRRKLNIQPGDALDVDVAEDGKILLTRHNPRCVFCSGQEHVKLMSGIGICRECAKKAMEV